MWQHERVELRQLLAALRQRLPPRPRARRGLGPERQERGLTERNGPRARGLGVAVLELERRAVEAVGEAAVGDADSGGGLLGVRDGDLLGTTPRGCGEGRMRSGMVPAALRVGGRLLGVGEVEADGGRQPWMGLLCRGEERATAEGGGSRHERRQEEGRAEAPGAEEEGEEQQARGIQKVTMEAKRNGA